MPGCLIRVRTTKRVYSKSLYRYPRIIACLLLTAMPLPVAADAVVVEIEGISGGMLENARTMLSLSRYDPDEVSEVRVRRLHARAPAEIATALQPFGYYRPRVESELRRHNGAWRARYVVDPGAPVRLTRVDLELLGAGADDPVLRQVLRGFALQPGDTADQRAYDRGRDSLRRRALERGYLDARFEVRRITVDPESLEATITLHLDTGERYRFGEVRLFQEILDDALVRRFVPFAPGDDYHRRDLLNMQYRLDDSDYFSRVEVEPRRDLAEDNAVPIDVYLAPRPRYRYTFGIGYGTDTGPRTRLGWQNRRVNRRGHQLAGDLTLSQVIQGITQRYTIPIADPATDHVTLRAGVVRERPEDRESTTQNLGVTHSRTFGRWQRALRLDLERERFDLGDGLESTTSLLLPGIGVTYTRADHRIYPTRGLRWNIDLKGAHTDLGSDLSFVQLYTELRYVHQLHPRGRLLLRGEAGGSSVEEFAELPISQRFFAGGDRSVRGFRYKSLGPVDDDGLVVGGKYLLTSSVEYEYRFAGNWAAAVFHDAGNAFDDTDEELARAAGVGLRWRTPVGPLGIDLARTLNLDDNRYRFHLSLGATF